MQIAVSGIFLAESSHVSHTAPYSEKKTDKYPTTTSSFTTKTSPTKTPTLIRTTQITPISTPQGDSTLVTLPYAETMQLRYNTIHRNFSSANTVILKYDVTPDQVNELRESSETGYATWVLRDDPNAYLLITIKDPRTGKIITTGGFARTFSSSRHQELTIRRTGNMEMEVTGVKVTVALSIEPSPLSI